MANVGGAGASAADIAGVTLTAGISGPTTAMGRVAVSEAAPVIRCDFTYGLPTGAFISTNSAGTGAVEGQRGYGEVKTGGTAAGAYATMFTPRPQRFRDGQGVETYFAVKYDTPQAGVVQLVGAFTAEDGYGVGYGNDPYAPPYDTDFKIHRKGGGLRQVETLTLSGASGAGTVDIALAGGAAVTVTLTASTLEQNAAEIAETAFSGWQVYNYDDGTNVYVVFIRDSAGPVTAATYATASGSPCSGSFALTTAGDLGTEVWTPQSSWNIDPLDGTGASGYTLDPQAWNTFGMRWTDTYCEWFWFGPAGMFVPFHREIADGSELVTNSSMPVQATAYNIATASAATTLQIAGLAGAVSGELLVIGARRARTTVTAGVGTTRIPLVSYRLAGAYAGPNSQSVRAFTGLVQFLIAKVINDGNRAGVVDIVINADLDKPEWTTVAGTNASAVREAVGGSFSVAGEPGGVTIDSAGVAKSSNEPLNVERLTLMLLRGQTITFVGRAVASTTELTVSTTWVEER